MNVYMDCRSGVTGGAVLAALCHLGVSVEPQDCVNKRLNMAALRELLRSAGLSCRLELREECGPAGAGCAVQLLRADSEVQKSRIPAADMRDVLLRSPVGDAVRRKALAVLDALVEAEAHTAACAPGEIYFEQAQAVDALVAILGVCWGLDVLGIERVLASPLPWVSGLAARSEGGGQGGAEGGKGAPPHLPRAATARLLQGKPIVISEQAGAHEACGAGEGVTALGAALLHVLAEDFSPGMQGRLQGVGVGYDAGASASVRVLLLAEDAVCRETITMLESHIDHLSGEELGVAIQELAALPEVLDVLWLPGIGKKNRPAGSLRVLCMPRHMAAVERAFFAHTHSLGVRCQHMERGILPRGVCTVDTASGPLRAKRYSVDGADYVRVECDALRTAAEERQRAPLSVARGELRRG